MSFPGVKLKQAEITPDVIVDDLTDSPPDATDNSHLNGTGLDLEYLDHLQNLNENYAKADSCCKRLLVEGTNLGDGIYIKNDKLMNGKITYISTGEDRALFWDRNYFTVGRIDEAELLVRSHTDT